jgi:hypothetical protein
LRTANLAAIFCFMAIQQSPAPRQGPSIENDSAPVTFGEYIIAIDRFAESLRLAFAPDLKMPQNSNTRYVTGDNEKIILARLAGWGGISAGSGSKFPYNSAITGYDVAQSLYNLAKLLEPRFIRPVVEKKIDESGLKLKVSEGRVRSAVLWLARSGLLPYESPIFKGGAIKPVTLAAGFAQFSERMGYHFRKSDTIRD